MTKKLIATTVTEEDRKEAAERVGLRKITQIVKMNRTYFTCDCGFNSTNKSAISRHKCRKNDTVNFHCPHCEKVCRNPGGLKRHINTNERQL